MYVLIINLLKRPKLESFANKTSSIPLLNLFSAVINDWIPLIEEYYYCEKHSFERTRALLIHRLQTPLHSLVMM
jgi:hypothetical protein